MGRSLGECRFMEAALRALFLCLLLLLPTSGFASTSADDLFALIEAGDFAGVETTLKAAQSADADRTKEPQAGRDLFAVFSKTNPAIATFTAKWLAAEPDNPYAMTAAGWQDYGLGFVLRGPNGARHTTPEALQRFRTLHVQAYDLFSAAVKSAPDLLAASDGLMRTSQSLGRIKTIPAEIDRVMALHPNRTSLMRAMFGPQWGGSIAIVDLLCDHFAPQITTVPDYSPAICRIDAVYFAHFPYGEDRDLAQQGLMATSAPILDHARLKDAIAGVGPAEERLTYLEALMAKGPLGADTARAYDMAFAKLNGLQTNDWPQYRKALPQAITDAEKQANLDPLNSEVVLDLYNLAINNRDLNDGPLVLADFALRFVTLLQGNPFDAASWLRLGKIRQGQGTLAELKAAQPYYDNALYYSRYDMNVLQEVIEARIWNVIDGSNTRLMQDPAAMSPELQADYDLSVYCPLARDLVAARLLCSEGGNTGACLSGLPDNERVMNELLEASNRHECKPLANGMDSASLLVQAPATVDLALP